MAIDFLGKQSTRKSGKTEAKISYHQPQKDKPEVKVKPKPIPPPTPTQPSKQAEALAAVNLATSFRAYVFKKRVEIFIIALILLVMILGGLFYYLTRPPQATVDVKTEPVVANVPAVINENINIPVETNTNEEVIENINIPVPEPVAPPEPVCGNALIETGEQCDFIGCDENFACVDCQCRPVILPDTELAPLRGTLIKLSDQGQIYLIDWNGEMRPVDQIKVVFKNGQTISQLDTRIYIINSRFQDIRHGKLVTGFVDWDPRVLTSEELQFFK